MAENSKLAKGIIFKAPHQNAPEFVVGKLSVKVEDFTNYLKANQDNGWVNFEVKLSRDGKPYVEIDTWKPAPKDEF
jgi:hypothetical protein